MSSTKLQVHNLPQRCMQKSNMNMRRKFGKVRTVLSVICPRTDRHIHRSTWYAPLSGAEYNDIEKRKKYRGCFAETNFVTTERAVDRHSNVRVRHSCGRTTAAARDD